MVSCAARRLAHRLMGVVEEQMPAAIFRTVTFRKLKIEVACVVDAEGFRQRRTLGDCSSSARKIAMRSTSSVRDKRSTTELSMCSRSVSELSSRPNSISVRR